MSGLDLPLDALSFRLASELKVDEFVAEIIDIVIKKDRHGRPTVQLHVYSPEHGRIIIALSPSYTNVMVQELKRMGFQALRDIIGKRFRFKRVKLSKVRGEYTEPYPRFIPTELVE